MRLILMFQLGVTVGGRWRPGIGDPTVMGWGTVAAYLVAGYLCMLAWRAVPRLRPEHGRRRLRLFFASTATIMLLLAINKQLDLQTYVTQIGKDLAKEQGWYAERRAMQRYFIYAIAGGGAVMLLLGLVAMRGLWRYAALILLGLSVTLSFVIIRAASFHHFDQVIGMVVAGVKVNVLLELSGVTLVALGAALNLAGTTPRARQQPPAADKLHETPVASR